MSLIATIQERVLETDEVIAQLERRATRDPRPSILANIRSMEKERLKLRIEFDRAAAKSNLDVCRYRVLARGDATLDGLTSVWRQFETALTVVYHSLKHGGSLPPGQGRKKKDKRKANQPPEPSQEPLRFGFGYTFPGSVGLALTLPNQTGLFPDDAIIQAADSIFELARTYGDPPRLHDLVRKLGPSPGEAIYRWVDAHNAYSYGVGIDWQRDGEVRSGVALQREELAVLRTELSKTTVE